ncbi:MFS transporter [Ramlibacter sp. H39-3-26]|uniref:MFS transporter n=1 Tax=Curvibacter soli TaxID=3031331 RepID=UPI0023DC00D7|nr:MFS transporter [Ramlibacter sp. H39-3-26]MDF1484378.1 MFS transporter [Ramlibacter sp. H39-3-26]
MASSSSSSPLPASAPLHPGISAGLTLLFAAACGLSVANIYYAQPLIAPIAQALSLPASLAGLIMTLTQLGYGLGLLLVVPLADVVENRRLIVVALGGVVLGLVGVACSTSAATFMAAALLVGVSTVATQIMVPFASLLAPDATRGKVVGNILGGLLAGIMLARPFASSVAALWGWRTVFAISAALMLVLMAVLHRMLPQRRPMAAQSYGRILASLPSIVRRTPLLRRRAAYQGAMFAGFNAFWTGVPLLLAHAFGMGQHGIAAFALAGAAGALVAPWAGRLADRGLTRAATGWALACAVLAFGLAGWAGYSRSLPGLVAAALVLDAAVQVCQVLSLRSIYMLAPELRGRLNGLFMTMVFVCGAVASGLSTAVYTLAGWPALAAMGAAFIAVALAFYATEFAARK